PLDDGLWQLDVHGTGPGMDDEAMRMVGAVRAVDAPFPALVGGSAANQYDQQAASDRNLPVAVALLVVSCLVLLWLMTGSVILPIKTLFMSLLTTAAATGILVFVFQHGRLESLLGYRSQGGI